ncbi:hypothetical protein [Flavobacterium orientale]|uniref:Uncharacterized protein n=1 Tax=Flavobacterium orientale TaxID=1756020 RepID=A0A916Y7K9_9FLAO|nr:hypothetical protein [Flavobacterium orientale]GGD34365.1 hypothetical protein GCM10011343_25330 [Flavobacterium orientale]
MEVFRKKIFNTNLCFLLICFLSCKEDKKESENLIVIPKYYTKVDYKFFLNKNYKNLSFLSGEPRDFHFFIDSDNNNFLFFNESVFDEENIPLKVLTEYYIKEYDLEKIKSNHDIEVFRKYNFQEKKDENYILRTNEKEFKSYLYIFIFKKSKKNFRVEFFINNSNKRILDDFEKIIYYIENSGGNVLILEAK